MSDWLPSLCIRKIKRKIGENDEHEDDRHENDNRIQRQRMGVEEIEYRSSPENEGYGFTIFHCSYCNGGELYLEGRDRLFQPWQLSKMPSKSSGESCVLCETCKRKVESVSKLRGTDTETIVTSLSDYFKQLGCKRCKDQFYSKNRFLASQPMNVEADTDNEIHSDSDGCKRHIAFCTACCKQQWKDTELAHEPENRIAFDSSTVQDIHDLLSQ